MQADFPLPAGVVPLPVQGCRAERRHAGHPSGRPTGQQFTLLKGFCVQNAHSQVVHLKQSGKEHPQRQPAAAN